MYRGPCSLLAQPFVLALVSSISQLHPPSALIWLCFCDSEAKFVPTCVVVLQAQPYLNHGEHMHHAHKVWLLCPRRAVVPNPGAPHLPTYRFGRPSSGDFCHATPANYTHLRVLIRQRITELTQHAMASIFKHDECRSTSNLTAVIFAGVGYNHPRRQ